MLRAAAWALPPFRHVTRRAPLLASYASRGLSSPVELSVEKHSAPKDGEGPHGCPVVVLHGLFGSKQNWRGVSKALASGLGRDVYAADLRNHGESPHAQEMTIEAMAQDVFGVIERARNESACDKVVLIGHSMGGKVAVDVVKECEQEHTSSSSSSSTSSSSSNRHHAVSSLVLVDVLPVAYTHTHMPYIKAMKALPLDTLTRRSELDRVLAESIPEAPIRQFLLTNLVHQPDGYFSWRINLDAIEGALQHVIHDEPLSPTEKVKLPTLIVAGQTSNYVQPHADKIPRLFERATVREIEGAGHWVHYDKAKEFVAEVVSFLASDGSAHSQ
eukprot:TRINITY_DN9964_c0_g1_i1.p1 TRINITY_DN9964_c0_g1~~TRINITY_DN9964_c0_g1_i1.p1  ORF type:complete len:330 (-),score=57.75 TRINITY_DN9964_c0_g1_i1:315-1304(-)